MSSRLSIFKTKSFYILFRSIPLSSSYLKRWKKKLKVKKVKEENTLAAQMNNRRPTKNEELMKSTMVYIRIYVIRYTFINNIFYYYKKLQKRFYGRITKFYRNSIRFLQIKKPQETEFQKLKKFLVIKKIMTIILLTQNS